MTKKRYVNTRDQSFFGNYIYDQVVPENHFLRLLNQLIDWDGFTERLIDLYRGGGEYGRPPFNPTQLLKMGLLAFFITSLLRFIRLTGVMMTETTISIYNISAFNLPFVFKTFVLRRKMPIRKFGWNR